MKTLLAFIRLLAYIAFGACLGFAFAAYLYNGITGCPTIL